MSTEIKHSIVIVGGGTAGITTAARLLSIDAKADILILDPASQHYYQPMWTLVGAGVVPKSATAKNQRDVIPKGVTWIQEAVETFVPHENVLWTTKGTKVVYKSLVLCPGIQINWNAIKGLESALGKGRVFSNYSFTTVEDTWKGIKKLKKGTALFTHPKGQIKCAGAPQKIMYLAEHHFSKTNCRSNIEVEFFSATPSIFGVKKYANTLNQIIKERNIKAHYQYNLVEIDDSQQVATFESLTGEAPLTKHYDFIHVTPPMSAPDFISKSELANAEGWVDVDKHTLQHPRFENIFSLGDASSLPTSKTGAAVRKQVPVLVDNLLSVQRGLTPEAKYDGYTSCPLVTRYGKVVLAEFDYDKTPQESFPFDQSKERTSMYFLKKYFLPKLYWQGMLRGRA